MHKKQQIFFLTFLALATVFLWAPGAEAFNDFGGNGTFNNCQACHSGVFGAGNTPQHSAHAAAVSNNCGVCHGGFPASLSNCTQCHVGDGLRQHHRNANIHQCSGCHTNPESPAPEDTVPPGYAGTNLDPCNGSEEQFGSFTTSLDNDGDLLYDGNDPDCVTLPANETNCTDGVDNDGDGFTDCDDQDCSADPACIILPTTEVSCTDGIDNDGDGFTDCADMDCVVDPACIIVPTDETNCTDGIDNDADGATDCADQDCFSDPACIILPTTEANCTDGIDNDSDGASDCADMDCFTDPACIVVPTNETNCGDGMDNDGDGFTDCADQDCSADPVCMPAIETSCTDGMDNDGDGFADCADQDCSTDPACISGGTNHLETTCLGCHEDRSAIATCATGTRHIVRVGQQVWDETLIELGLSCGGNGGGDTGGGTDGPPADHTDRERDDGITGYHKPGKDNPFTNGCTACHGDDLRGGISPSCYTCHGKEWDEDAPSGGGTDGPPADHTDRERDDGITGYHKPGKDNPFTNGCTACHGSDLRGGIAPSCFTCHGTEWDEDAPTGDGDGDGDSGFNPPADHTDREEGFMHRPGKDNPFTNGCTACHGSDLRGGIAPSCYTCHGTEWDEDAPGNGGGTGGGTDGPPADHTDREEGFMHRPGKDNPFTNGCTACHGQDLRGGIAPSCYTCHGVEWRENGSGGNDDGDRDRGRRKSRSRHRRHRD